MTKSGLDVLLQVPPPTYKLGMLRGRSWRGYTTCRMNRRAVFLTPRTPLKKLRPLSCCFWVGPGDQEHRRSGGSAPPLPEHQRRLQRGETVGNSHVNRKS